jgi:putative transposase
MVEHPGEYRWSSYRANGQGEDNALIRPHSLYDASGLMQSAGKRLIGSCSATNWSRGW